MGGLSVKEEGTIVKDFAGQLKADARPDASQPGVSLPGITPQDFLLKEER